MKKVFLKLIEWLYNRFVFESTYTQYRYIMYIEGIPFFLIRKKDLYIKRKCIEFIIHEPIKPECYRFISNMISGNKKVGDVSISKMGPLGDIVQEIHYRGNRIKSFNIRKEMVDEKIDGISDAMRMLKIKMKFNNCKKI